MLLVKDNSLAAISTYLFQYFNIVSINKLTLITQTLDLVVNVSNTVAFSTKQSYSTCLLFG